MTPDDYRIRRMQPLDYDELAQICAQVYPTEAPYTRAELEEHHRVFPEGQFVAEHAPLKRVVGAHYTLIVRMADFHADDSWEIFTARGTFDDHDPQNGHTLYGADIMVAPDHQRHGLAHALTKAAQNLVIERNLWRMVGASRLPGYGRLKNSLSPPEYVRRVLGGEIVDPVLTAHLRDGWQFVKVVSGYLPHDDESAQQAAIIQWLNPKSPPPPDANL